MFLVYLDFRTNCFNKLFLPENLSQSRGTPPTLQLSEGRRRSIGYSLPMSWSASQKKKAGTRRFVRMLRLWQILFDFFLQETALKDLHFQNVHLHLIVLHKYNFLDIDVGWVVVPFLLRKILSLERDYHQTNFVGGYIQYHRSFLAH